MAEPPMGSIAFSRYLAEGKIMGSRCCSCGAISVPPRPLCRMCSSHELEWTEITGRGKLVSFTCTAVCPPAMAERGYSAEAPYCVGVVSLEEGANVVALIDGVDTRHPGSISIGMPLIADRAVAGEEANVCGYLVFRPV